MLKGHLWHSNIDPYCTRFGIRDKPYLKDINLSEQIKSIDKPIFVTSPKKEIEQVSEVVKLVSEKWVTQFKPQVAGFHGSKTLWESVKGHETYWNAHRQFLNKVEPC